MLGLADWMGRSNSERWLIIGLILVALVSLLPVIFRKVKARQGESVEI